MYRDTFYKLLNNRTSWGLFLYDLAFNNLISLDLSTQKNVLLFNNL